VNENSSAKNKDEAQLNKNLRKTNESNKEEIKEFLKKETSFKEKESLQKEDISQKLKDELNQLKTLTKEASGIFSDKEVNVKNQDQKNTIHNRDNNSDKENFSHDENNRKTINFQKRKEQDLSIQQKNSTINNPQENFLLEQEFEDKLSYLIDKLDIINLITK